MTTITKTIDDDGSFPASVKRPSFFHFTLARVWCVPVLNPLTSYTGTYVLLWMYCPSFRFLVFRSLTHLYVLGMRMLGCWRLFRHYISMLLWIQTQSTFPPPPFVILSPLDNSTASHHCFLPCSTVQFREISCCCTRTLS